MKLTVVLIFTLLLLNAGHDAKAQVSGYIKFDHIGQQDKPINSLIISTQKVKIPLSADESKILKDISSRGIVDNEGFALWQNRVITDKRSYQLLKVLIKNSKLFESEIDYTKPHSLAYGTFHFFDGTTTLYLNSTNSGRFFKQAILHLRSNKCDERLTKAIDQILRRVA